MSSFFRYSSTFTIALLVFVFAASAAVAQSGRISGTVTDREGGVPLPGANVTIAGTTIGAAADIDGNYTIRNVSPGQHTLRASYLGYEPVTAEVTVLPGETVTLDLQLSWQGVMGQEILVTAQVAGQTAAINQQLASNTITNIVSRDRIQEVPDVNAAESIGRLPGVSIHRSGGEANRVAIRGLSPKHNAVTVNGVRMPATGGDDRSVDLSLVSSNMLDGIEVMKAITPDRDADAIGGSVDLRLREAPAGLRVDVSGQGGYNRLQDHLGNYRFAGTASNRFLGDQLGLMASFNVDEYDRSADVFGAGYRTSTTVDGEAITVPTQQNLREQNVTRDRIGGSLVADYRIPLGKVTANTFYNRLGSDGLIRTNNYSISEVRQYFGLQRNQSATSVLTSALNVEQDHGWFSYDANVSRSTSSTHAPENFDWMFSREGGRAFADGINDSVHPRQIYELASIDTTRTGLASIWVRGVDRQENITTTQLNFQVPFRFGNNIDGHVRTGGRLRWLDRYNDESQAGRTGLLYGSGQGSLNPAMQCLAAQLPDWNLDEIVGREGHLPINLALADYQRGDFLGEYNLNFPLDQGRMMQLTRALQNCPDNFRNNSAGSRGRDYDGIERYQAAYMMSEVNLGPYVRFIPGFRWEGDYSRYTGQRYREVIGNALVDEEPANLEVLTTERSHSFLLPMVHMIARPNDWLTVRLAYTETLTRPDFIQFAPITVMNGFNNHMRAANSLLRPAHSTNYDAAVSIYQRHVGLFTVAGFAKSIDDYIIGVNYNQVDPTRHPEMEPFEGFNIPEEWYSFLPMTWGIDTFINNPHEAVYRGVEFDWQTNFWYLPRLFQGAVLNMNYTYIFSDTRYDSFHLIEETISVRPIRTRFEMQTHQRAGRMQDQPRHIANVTLGYDFRGFSTRVSYLYQSNRAASISAVNPIMDAFSDAYHRWDISARQQFGNGLEVFTNLNNVSSVMDRNYLTTGLIAPNYEEAYGFTMDIGLRYRFGR